jgi:lipid II isoglutaminyl synthase (glutamine-hydrolysing)
MPKIKLRVLFIIARSPLTSRRPLIPKNPFIADWMIKIAIKNKYGEDIQLTKLDDSLADRARSTILDRLGVKGET